MPSLLDQAIAAHGGMKLWRELSRLRVRFSAGGLLFVSKWVVVPSNGTVLIDLSRPRTAVLSPYPGPGQRGVFEPDRVWVESEDGTILKERRDPRESFRGLRRALWWDHLDVLYFAGYALWNYLCAPFLFARPTPGCGTRASSRLSLSITVSPCRCTTTTRTGTSSSCRAIISAIGSDRPSGCERLPISDPIPSGRFSIQRRCIKRTQVASRSRSYSPPSALGSSYRIRSPASACRFPSTRDPQQPDERHSDCNPKRERLVARVIKLEVRL